MVGQSTRDRQYLDVALTPAMTVQSRGECRIPPAYSADAGGVARHIGLRRSAEQTRPCPLHAAGVAFPAVLCMNPRSAYGLPDDRTSLGAAD